MKASLHTFESAARLEVAAAELLRWHLRVSLPVPHGVMLTGGRTPLGTYARVASAPPACDRRLHLLLSDERHVPGDSPQSNAGHLRGLIAALGLPDERVLSVDTRLPLEEAAARYDARLAVLATTGRLTLAILGLGADGHVASLFTPEDVARGEGRFAIAVPRTPPPARVSVTPEFLRLAERVVFLVAGAEKQDAVDSLINRPESIAAGLALTGRAPVAVWYCP